jgi:lipopolysaccharide transport system ATP-binding protein
MSCVVKVEGLSKRFRIGVTHGADSLVSRLAARLRGEEARSPEYFWALDDVSFEVGQGEILGIVGRNGSGKSTLLKILANVMRPTRGRAIIHGRVGALLEVGTGFHGDLTGRENVYFNGTLLGMSRDYIRSKFDEIVEFSGIEKFIDTPIKHYSSGMHTRLAFAVAVNLQPEVLILDEVLTVGDVFFQEKCVEKVNALTRSGITILYVSHSLSTVGSMCNTAMLLDEGRVTAFGRPYEILSDYVSRDDVQEAEAVFEDEDAADGDAGAEGEDAPTRRLRSERDFPARFLNISAEKEDGTPASEFDLLEDIYFRFQYRVKAPIQELQLVVMIRSGFEHVVQTYDTDDQAFIGEHPRGVFERRVKIERMFLKEGRYTVSLISGTRTELMDTHYDAVRFDVVCRLQDLNMEFKSYRRDRPGRIIFRGEWVGGRRNIEADQPQGAKQPVQLPGIPQ